MGNYISYQVEPKLNKFGWKRDLPDHRDQKVYFTETSTDDIDLRNKCPDVYDQGKLGSCTANAISFAYEFDQMKQKEESPFAPSRLFIYYNERDADGSVETDSGSTLRTGIKVINRQGVCKRSDWPYDITQFTTKPPTILYEEAKNHRSIKYKKINQTISQIKMALKTGYPIVFGVSIYESFESLEAYSTGNISMPNLDEKMLGGHAIALVGFNDKKRHFIFRNSWGKEWGDKGYGYIPYNYVSDPNLAGDFWIVEKVLDID
jgi:C1A family cysteine protease